MYGVRPLALTPMTTSSEETPNSEAASAGRRIVLGGLLLEWREVAAGEKRDDLARVGRERRLTFVRIEQPDPPEEPAPA